MFINEEPVSIEQVNKRNKGGVMFRRNEKSTRLSFFLQKTQFAFAVRFVQNIMNIEIAPSPRDEGLLRGLLGNFDGSTENDLKT